MIIDSHAHLDMKDFDKDRDEVIEGVLTVETAVQR